MSKIPTNVSPKIYTLSAVAVGFLLIDDLNSNEQNALGNWLMLASQVLCTNAYFKQLQNKNNEEISNSETIDMLSKMINVLNKEVEELKKTNHFD